MAIFFLSFVEMYRQLGMTASQDRTLEPSWCMIHKDERRGFLYIGEGRACTMAIQILIPFDPHPVRCIDLWQNCIYLITKTSILYCLIIKEKPEVNMYSEWITVLMIG